jgi:hypothetical protein
VIDHFTHSQFSGGLSAIWCFSNWRAAQHFSHFGWRAPWRAKLIMRPDETSWVIDDTEVFDRGNGKGLQKASPGEHSIASYAGFASYI